VVVRHDDDDSLEQQRRRHWDNEGVSHLLSVLDNAELSSSCSASQTSCSGSASQTSCAADDNATTSRHVMFASGETATQPTTSTGLPFLL